MANRYREKIIERVEPVIDAEGMELVDVECLRMKTRWLVRIYIDKEGGVTIDDCTDISRQVGDLLDVYDIPPGPYTLEVSSPGLDRPLFTPAQAAGYAGQTVEVRLHEPREGRKNFKGVLKGVQGDVLTVDVDGREETFAWEAVKKARLVYDFGAPAPQGRRGR